MTKETKFYHEETIASQVVSAARIAAGSAAIYAKYENPIAKHIAEKSIANLVVGSDLYHPTLERFQLVVDNEAEAGSLLDWLQEYAVEINQALLTMGLALVVAYLITR